MTVINKSISIIFALLLISVADVSDSIAQVDSVNIVSQEVRDTIRTSYVRSAELPTGIAFVSTIRLISKLNSSDPEGAQSVVSRGLQTNLEDARQIIEVMELSYDRFQSNFAEVGEGLACDNGTAKHVGDQVFDDLMAIDDAEVSVSEQAYAEFAENLDSATLDQLQNWLADRKLEITYETVDHKKLAVRTGVADVDLKVSALCGANWKPRG